MNKTSILAVVSTLLACSGRAQEAEAKTDSVSGSDVDAKAVQMEKFSVVGRGETRATSTLAKVDIQIATPGLDPMLVLRTLPGITVQTNDDLGLYEFGESVRLRGFDSTQISFDVDGVPMGRNDPRGNPVGRFIDTEMMDSITLSQGSGDVGTPAYSALGGAIHYFTSSPRTQLGFETDLTLGSRNLHRYFYRADTGTFGGGMASYVSYSRTSSNVSIGPGGLVRDHIEAKLQKMMGTFKVTAGYRYNDRFDHDVFSIDRASFYSGQYQVLFDGFTGDPATDTANYQKWINARRDHLINVTFEGQLTPEIKITVMPYYQNQRGRGTAWEDSTDAGFTSLPYQLISRLEIQKDNREGVTGRLEQTFDIGKVSNTLTAGFWFEHEGYSRVRIEYPLGGAGSSLAGQYRTAQPPPPYIDLSRPLGYIYYHSIVSDVRQFYIDDKFKLLDNKLTLNLGLKALDVDRTFKGLPNKNYYKTFGVFTQRKKAFVNNFGPQVGAIYDITPRNQVFANYAHNYSVPAFNYFTAANFDSTTKSETADNLDVGVRTGNRFWDAAFTGYLIKYHHRLLEVTPPAGSDVSTRGLVGQPVLQNVGSVDTKGLEASVAWKPVKGLRVNVSVTYTDSKFNDNYFNGTTLVPVKGKRTPEVPVFSLQTSADYNFGSGLSVGLSEQTQTRRYSTFVNDDWAPGFTTFSAHAGFQLQQKYWYLKDPFVRINVNNVFDKKYLGQVDGVSESGPNFYYPGARTAVYVVVGTKF